MIENFAQLCGRQLKTLNCVVELDERLIERFFKVYILIYLSLYYEYEYEYEPLVRAYIRTNIFAFQTSVASIIHLGPTYWRSPIYTIYTCTRIGQPTRRDATQRTRTCNSRSHTRKYGYTSVHASYR